MILGDDFRHHADTRNTFGVQKPINSWSEDTEMGGLYNFSFRSEEDCLMQFGDAPQAPLNGAYYPDEDMQETTGEGDTRIRSMGNIKGDETETEMTEKKSTLDYTMGDANTIAQQLVVSYKDPNKLEFHKANSQMQFSAASDTIEFCHARSGAIPLTPPHTAAAASSLGLLPYSPPGTPAQSPTLTFAPPLLSITPRAFSSLGSPQIAFPPLPLGQKRTRNSDIKTTPNLFGPRRIAPLRGSGNVQTLSTPEITLFDDNENWDDWSDDDNNNFPVGEVDPEVEAQTMAAMLQQEREDAEHDRVWAQYNKSQGGKRSKQRRE